MVGFEPFIEILFHYSPLFVTWKIGKDKRLRGCIGTFSAMRLHSGNHRLETDGPVFELNDKIRALDHSLQFVFYFITHIFFFPRSSRIRNNKCFKGFPLLAHHARRDPKTDRVGVDPAGLRGGPRLPGLDARRARYPDRVLQRTRLETNCHLPAAGCHRAR